MSQESHHFSGYLAGVGESIHVEIEIAGGRIQSLRYEPQAKAGEHNTRIWILPSVWDIQTNGRWGISFSDADLSVQQVIQIVRAQPGLGTTRLLPTLITASREGFRHGVTTIAEACETDPLVGRMIAGILWKALPFPSLTAIGVPTRKNTFATGPRQNSATCRKPAEAAFA